MNVRLRRTLKIGIGIGCLLLAALFIVPWIWSRIASAQGHRFYTVEETATGEAALKALFVGGDAAIPPFDYGGHLAVSAQVYSCDNEKTRFVAYLQRYTAEARNGKLQAQADLNAEQARSGDAAKGAVVKYAMRMMSYDITGLEVKRPGPDAWVKKNSPAGAKITQVVCPDGGMGNPVPVEP